MDRIKIIKELRDYYSFYYFCLWGGPWTKAEWIYENKIKPIAREHPILDFMVSLI